MHRLEELRNTLEETKAKTNWSQISKGHTANRDYLGQENRLRELKQELARLEDEQQVQRQLTIKKTELIEQQSRRLDELRNVAEHLNELKDQLKDKESEKVDLLDELRTLQRIYHKKECLIKDMQKDNDVKDPVRIKRLESDKRVLQYEITKHADGKRQNDKTIQAQHYRLKTLEAKLQAIGTALKSMKKKDLSEEEVMRFRPNMEDSAAELVEAVHFKNVQGELEGARRHIESKDLLMMQKDVTIEVLEKKVEILVNARDVLHRKLKLEAQEKEKEKRHLCVAIEKDEEVHRDSKGRLERDRQHYDTLINRARKAH
ncbi:hypothetical protein DIPPA_33575 [Diplonema papillatum]|nr:hypothetical protein DIPPA_33575 [Diplonema papillatum]